MGDAQPSDGAACPGCGAAGQALLANDAFAHGGGSCCSHAACEQCLRGWVAKNLGRCRVERSLRLQCYVAGCRKALPQKLVLAVSSEARGLALEIDHEQDRLDSHWGELQVEWKPTDGCTICADYQGPLVDVARCGHRACPACWERWFEEQLPKCLAAKQLQFCCFSCSAGVPPQVALNICPAGKTLNKRLERRRQLQRNQLFPQHFQVDCPQPGCIGLGYLGFDTIMCFMCEFQWPAVDPDAVGPNSDVPGEIKKCPKCNARIEKNGGCDHMTCRCHYEFSWTTLAPWGVEARG